MGNVDWEYCSENYGEGCAQNTRSEMTEEILDFANMVFSVEHGCTDFASLLPKAYSPDRCGIPTHHMIREGNKLRALIDLYPVELHLQGIAGSAVRAAYVGTVAVHPHARGRGYMIELMKRAEEDARRQGCALMMLDGDRHRYQYYGFERAGIRYQFYIEMGNIRHCCAKLYAKEDMASPAFGFEEIEENSPHLERLYQLYQRRMVTARSLEDFWLCLQSYNASAYAILRYGEPVGYVNLSQDRGTVLEIEVVEIRDLCRILHDMMQEFGMEHLHFSAGVDEQGKILELERACDSVHVSMSHQIKILDYTVVLKFLLQWKQAYSVLSAGDYVLGIENSEDGGRENYLLSVRAEQIDVSRTERAADTVLDPLELVRVLTTPFCFAEQQKGSSKIKNAPSGWFPLPFYLPEGDAF